MILRRFLLTGFLFVVLLNTTNGQSLAFDTYSNRLLFNIFKDQPDTAIRGFLRLYAPSLLDKKITAANPGSSGGGKGEYSFEVHTYLFTSHPYFSTGFTNGKLELYCRRLHNGGDIQVYDVKLWFEFNTPQEGEIAFSKLIEIYRPISTNERFGSSVGAQRAEFSDTKGKGINKVQFRLTVDNLDRHTFKILFETTNDL